MSERRTDLSQVDDASQDPADEGIPVLARSDIRRRDGEIDPGPCDVEGHLASQGPWTECQARDIPRFCELRGASNLDVIKDPVSCAINDNSLGHEAPARTNLASASQLRRRVWQDVQPRSHWQDHCDWEVNSFGFSEGPVEFVNELSVRRGPDVRCDDRELVSGGQAPQTDRGLHVLGEHAPLTVRISTPRLYRRH